MSGAEQPSGQRTSAPGARAKIQSGKKNGAWSLARLALAVAVSLGVAHFAGLRFASAASAMTLVLLVWRLTRPRDFNGRMRARTRTRSRDMLSKDGPTITGDLRWAPVPSETLRNGGYPSNGQKPMSSETDTASIKFLLLNAPPDDLDEDAVDAYPYSWHFANRKRLWEVRVQVRLKVLPEDGATLYFGLETLPPIRQKLSASAKSANRLLLRAIQGFVGKELYHSPGDNPAAFQGECEPPTFAMPMWAIDMFHVANPGEEPDISGDLSGIGFRRTDGLTNYISEMNKTVENFSKDKVYTFCFWGISQFVDAVNWEFRGLFPSFRMDANKLCGRPPVYIVAYQMKKKQDDPRHLVSLKKYYFKIAFWSALHLPDPGTLAALAEERKLPAPGAPILGAGSSAVASSSSSREKSGTAVQALRRFAFRMCSG
eukprot:TRINITY_DN46899_c0_g1_i1.p1 TRINITY_DN46899_c0_g1~~TRINITY_DN46899_c0_g1_i1.p1  ORF type:complete len:453 (+),score=73.40 TRINITY_DN46899_c0_g1_i1:74-1360(+)